MNWNGVREAVSFLAVVASLVFVGLTTDAEFSELWFRAWSEGGEIDPSDEKRVEMMMALNLRRLENVCFQYQEGLVDESALRSYGLQVMAVFSPAFEGPTTRRFRSARGRVSASRGAQRRSHLTSLVPACRRFV